MVLHYVDSHHSKKTSSKKMDAYLAPFVNEMKLIWKDIRIYDISCIPSNRSFVLYDVLCWTIHDFPRLDVCSSKVKYLCIYTHNLFSSQLSYLQLYYYFDFIKITYWFVGFKQKGYLHLQDVQNNFNGIILNIYKNIIMQTTGLFYH